MLVTKSCNEWKKINKYKRRLKLLYLSQVVLYVEELCVFRQVDHPSDVVFGLVDDGHVEQPADTKNKIKLAAQQEQK